ncbi:hypothetical protein PFAG_02487 [Plasmodium falciparum Santa Lucia]|uniref:Uncharacterized protein n=8 Tax=Plasmodium falciparum TaxID=5833 RepID=C0H554_PLAF7|nr:conserved protein, unknown function [Plasmodium falciparum 3D7]ETW36751.1 hypothetical protein PFTANZ_02574 [Plasmodium falciparum Tanzania (2000708)]ETW43189.1 hypothetical protein PFNF135_02663 [Plasmodium falciparum NF135/5.C10]ETW55191.1 hypothetical protein PFUGPA_03011 [Plasmodium falciparum Palo Alto/Uganda]EUT86621.1 hypothetical protein PFAG_02487 [Plasmodium falciparum Santa Lucia]EWC76815.1 hypothetical protein C923_02606 [Plasmodium falciparum UGT5.1]KAF4330720.1 hypothetical p|eukprot:XP_002808950.1 conserved protein, unknown function [Plasmodium falciparum 3D7]
MVLIHAKGIEDNHQFLYETNVNILVEDLKKELTQVHNFQSKILKLCDASIELAKHGPLRPEGLRGLCEEDLKIMNTEGYNPKDATNLDQYNFRTGIPPAKEEGKKLMEVVEHVKNELSIHRIEKNMTVNVNKLNEYLNLIIQALNSCYPSMESLPAYDPTRLIIEKDNPFNDQFVSTEMSLWWAGKEMNENLYLKNIIGVNEKTKLIVKVQPKKFGAPVREARVDHETYKAMLAYYYKKQKEEKEFEEDDDDSYLNSEWANPLSLQKQLHGNLNNIKWKP